MDNDTNPSLVERVAADLALVETKIAAIQIELKDLLISKLRLTDALDVMKSYLEDKTKVSNPQIENMSTEEEAVTATGSFPKLDESSPMYGKSVPEAAVYLINQAKRPLTAKEIVKRMQDLGVVFTMPDPIMSANLSLNKRKNLVTRLKGGKWSIKETVQHDKEVWTNTGCVKRLSDDEHYEKTLAGLAAARARGVRGGRRPVMVNGKDEKARELLQQGIPPTKVAQEIGISRSAIYRFIEDNNINTNKRSKSLTGTEDI